MRHPMQPMVVDESQTVRFKENTIIRWLVDQGHLDLNQIASMEFPQEDRVQLAQLIGYSLKGFHELSFVPDVVAKQASKAAGRVLPGASGCRDAGCTVHSGVPDEPDKLEYR